MPALHTCQLQPPVTSVTVRDTHFSLSWQASSTIPFIVSRETYTTHDRGQQCKQQSGMRLNRTSAQCGCKGQQDFRPWMVCHRVCGSDCWPTGAAVCIKNMSLPSSDGRNLRGHCGAGWTGSPGGDHMGCAAPAIGGSAAASGLRRLWHGQGPGASAATGWLGAPRLQRQGRQFQLWILVDFMASNVTASPGVCSPRRPVTDACRRTCSRKPWGAFVGEHQRPQRRQPRQHGGQRAVVALPGVAQRQARQPAELGPVLQLHALEHPACCISRRRPSQVRQHCTYLAPLPESARKIIPSCSSFVVMNGHWTWLCRTQAEGLKLDVLSSAGVVWLLTACQGCVDVAHVQAPPISMLWHSGQASAN
jgi:hypothetical protein